MATYSNDECKEIATQERPAVIVIFLMLQEHFICNHTRLLLWCCLWNEDFIYFILRSFSIAFSCWFWLIPEDCHQDKNRCNYYLMLDYLFLIVNFDCWMKIYLQKTQHCLTLWSCSITYYWWWLNEDWFQEDVWLI